MEIRLTDDYRITSDSYNLILQKRSVIKKENSENYGEETWTAISWHHSFESIIRKLIILEVKQSEIVELQKMCELISGVEKRVSKRLEDIKQLESEGEVQ